MHITHTIRRAAGSPQLSRSLLVAAALTITAGCAPEPDTAEAARPAEAHRAPPIQPVPPPDLPRAPADRWRAPPTAEPPTPIQQLRPPTRGPLIRPTPAPPARFPYDAEGCHWLFRQDHVPTFHIDLTPETLRLLAFDREVGYARNELELEDKPYHRVESFRYEDVQALPGAQIRLRGNPNFWAGQNKFQFQVSFDEENRFGHFLGQRKILFDAAQFNRSFMRDRLSYSIAREAGLAAPCANNARIVLNGEYYGLFTLVEKIDEVFLWNRLRQPSGDLWKRANWRLRTNESRTDERRVEALLSAGDLAELDRVMHVPIAARVLAFEALLPAPDGAWAGGLNAYYYDDPHTGRFVHLPWDYDGAFTQSDNKYLDPLRWEKPERSFGRPFYDLITHDPAGLELYVDQLEGLLEDHYRPAVLIARIDRWQAQIEQAMLDDPNKPFDAQLHYERTDRLRAHIDLRARFVRDWIDCHRAGGMYIAEVGCGPRPEGEPYGAGGDP